MNQLSRRFFPGAQVNSEKGRKTSGVVLVSFEINDIFERKIIDTLGKMGVKNLSSTHIDSGRDRHLRITWQPVRIDASQEIFELTLRWHLMPTPCELRVHFGRRKRIAMLVSDHLHSLNDLLLINAKNLFPTDVRLIASTQLAAEGCSLKRRVRFRLLSSEGSQLEAENDLLMLLREHKIDTLVLSNSFNFISPNFIKSFSGDIVCLKLSALPSRSEITSYEDAFLAGEKVIASTSTYLKGSGQRNLIIEDRAVCISSTEKKEIYIQKCKENESAVLFRTLRAHCQNRIVVTNEGCIIHS